MRLLSLFSGIGLHDLGLERAGWEVAGQVECDRWCLAVLAKHWPSVPRWEDVRDVTAESIRERAGIVDLITGGFPCTDISLAGKGAGLSGEQSGLWREMLRIIRGVAPAWVFVENVPALRTRGAQQVVSDLEESGYTVLPPVVVGAWAAGAPHRRDRVWIVARLADADRLGRSRRSTSPGREEGRLASGSERSKPNSRRVGNPPGERGGEQDDARYSISDDGRQAHQEGSVSGGPGGRGVGNPEDLGRRARQGRTPEPGEPAAGRPVSGGAACPGVADAGRNGIRQLEQREPAGREARSLRDGGEAEPGGLRPGGVADTHGAGLAEHGGEPGDAREERAPALGDGRPGVADSESERPGEAGRLRHGEQTQRTTGGSWPGWPAGRGEPQHAWEPPRLTQPRMGGDSDGRSSRLDSFARRNRLRALGNANPPQVPELIGRWILSQP